MMRVHAQSACQQSGMVGGRSQHLLFQRSQRLLRHFRQRTRCLREEARGHFHFKFFDYSRPTLLR